MIHYIHQSITHKGVEVHYIVDYQKMTVSIVDEKRNPKSYKFAERTIDYLTPWIDILEAIQIAVSEGKELLKQRDKENTDKRVDQFIAMHEAMDKTSQN